MSVAVRIAAPCLFLLAAACALKLEGTYGGPSRDADAGEDALAERVELEGRDPADDPEMLEEGDSIDGGREDTPPDTPGDEPTDAESDDTAEDETAPGPWLEPWARRVRLDIDPADIDEDLHDFPALVYLSGSSGREPDNVGFVFDELGGDENRGKIAVTRSDAVTQCYVEIEEWDSAGRTAWLWVKVPFVSAWVSTKLYLYFDASVSDNTDRVGDTGTPAAQNVWEGGYRGVWHLGAGEGSDIPDSTPDGNHCTLGRHDHWVAGGAVDGAYDFDGSDDWAECGDDPGTRPGGTVTLEGWLYIHSFGEWNAALGQQWDTDDHESGYWIGSESSGGPLVWWININGTGWVKTSFAANTAQWYYVAGVYDGGNARLYVDGLEEDTAASSGSIDYDPSPYAFYMARYHDDNEDFKMHVRIDEVRLSDTTRSAAWIRASYESASDDLVDFHDEEVR